MTTDSDDLRDYLRKGDENAFRRIVERHSAMVHGVATRMTGNRALAEEVTQSVFCTLARKAKSIGHPETARWLYTVAVSECRNACRKEARRTRLMESYSNSMNTTATGEDESWADIRPHLDEALQRLSSGDRQFIILRFMENRSFREIAAFTGKTEENCRQMSRRAIERLRKMLNNRIALSSSATLAAVLASHSATSPSVSAATIAATAMQSLPASPVSAGLVKTILYMNTQKITKVSIIALVMAAIPATLYLKPEPLPLKNREGTAALGAHNGGDASDSSSPREGKAAGGGIDWDTVAANYGQSNPVTQLLSIRKLHANFKGLSPGELATGLEDITKSDAPEMTKLKLREMLVDVLAPQYPIAVLDRFEKDVALDMEISLTPGIRELAKQDFAAARAWLEKKREEGGFDKTSPDGAPRYLQYYQGALLSPLVSGDPVEFGKQFLALPPEERGHAVEWAVERKFDRAADAAIKSGDPAVLNALLESDYTLSSIKMNNTNGNSNDAIFALLDQISDPSTRERITAKLNAVANQSYKADEY